jgi:hypothetical protein
MIYIFAMQKSYQGDDFTVNSQSDSMLPLKITFMLPLQVCQRLLAFPRFQLLPPP